MPSDRTVIVIGVAILDLVQGGWDDGHPLWAGFSRFVPRLSWKDSYLLNDLPGDPTAIAKSLAQAGADAQLVIKAHAESGRRVVLEPDAWQNQRLRRERPVGFRALGDEASLAGSLDPAVLRSASVPALLTYTQAFLNPQLARGADALVLPFHTAGRLGRACREGELRLAQVGSALARREQLALRGDAAKPLLVGIAIKAADITNAAAATGLAQSYASIDADGYWVQFVDLTEATAVDTVRHCSTFLFALQSLADRRVFAVDVKNLVWPLLAGGLYGVCLGIGEREAFRGPAELSSVQRMIKPTVVHPELLRNFVASGPIARQAFTEYPCECDAHQPEDVPQTRTEIRRHALLVRLIMAEGATSASAEAVVKSWLSEASWAAAELGLDQPRSEAYRAALAASREWRSVANE